MQASATETLGSPAATLVDLLCQRAAQQPEQLLYRFVESDATEVAPLSYAALDQEARTIAAQLQQQGLTGQRALLLYPPGLAYIAAFFGCLYANVAAVPVYPPNPNRLARMLPRLRAIAQNARPAAVLTTDLIAGLAGPLLEGLDEFPSMVWVATDTLAPTLAAAWRAPPTSPQTLAFLQYTSGSTAAPKGVMLTHANLLSNSRLIARNFQHSPTSCGVIWLPPYHDMGLIGGIIQPLYAGFPVTLMSPTTFLQSPLVWLETISRTRATTSGGPNFAYDLCVRRTTPEQRRSLDLSSWRVAFNGAEPIRAETLERFVEAFGPCGFRPEAFRPCYGLAESTLIVTSQQPGRTPSLLQIAADRLAHHEVRLADPHDQGAATLVGSGQPLDGYEVVVVDPATSQPRLPGQVGEIWVAGPSVAQGYWDNPAETTRSFQARLSDRPDTFLRTGDLGFLHEGGLFVTGRLKDVIILRGRNLYPQDLELTAEGSHPAIRVGCVAAFGAEVASSERLVVMLEVERSFRAGDVDGLVAGLRQALAEQHEVQVYAVVLLKTGQLPKTSSGKIQRHLCREAFLNGGLDELARRVHDELPADAPAPAAPSSLPEQTRNLGAAERTLLLQQFVREQIAAVLRTNPDRLDLDLPLGASGLDSLAVIELQAVLEQTLGVRVPAVLLLSAISVARLAAQLAPQLDQTAAEPVAAVDPRGRLAYGQSALWFLHQLAPEQGIYTIARAVRVRGALDSAALERAVQRLIAHHPALRTTFMLVDGQPTRRVHDSVPWALGCVDATDWSDAAVQARIASEAQRPFDLERGPLLRISLLARGPQEQILIFAVHHLVVDLWSLAVLITMLQTLYMIELGRAVAAPPVLEHSYDAFVARQAGLLLGRLGDLHWQYWQAQLAGASFRIDLPDARPRPAQPSYHGGLVQVALEPGLSQRLRKLASAQHTSLYALLMAAWQVLLHRLSGQAEIVVGTPLAGRGQPNDQHTVGYFVNPVALRGHLGSNPRFCDFLDQVNRAILEAIDHQDYPFALVVARLGLTHEGQHGALFDAVLNWQKLPPTVDPHLAGLALEQPGAQMAFGPHMLEGLTLEQRRAEFDLELTLAEIGPDLVGNLLYSRDRFDPDSAARLIERFVILLEALAADPTRPVRQLPLLRPAEQHLLLEVWDDRRSYPHECAHLLFMGVAAKHPDLAALAWEGGQISYAALDGWSSRIAQRLIAEGLQPGQIVAVLLESDTVLVAALLAVLKSGATFVCLDPNAPDLRLEQLLAETEPKLLLASPACLARHHALLQQRWEAGGLLTLVLGAAGQQRSESGAAWRWLDEASAPCRAPALAVAPDSPIYIAYTSGSTGSPKGILHTHASFCQFISWQSRQFRIGPGSRMAQLALATFDVSYCEIFGALCFGATLCIPQPNIRQDPLALAAWLQREQVTVLQIVPSLLRQILRVVEPTRPDQHPLARLEHLLFVGEALPVELVRELLSQLPERPRLYNVYGPTEAVAATCYPISAVAPDQRSVPIGRPADGRQILILDQDDQLCPAGVKGQIVIRSDFLAQGYFRRPEETARAFGVNPLRPDSSDRVYRTGDLARWLPDGLLEYCGRADHQIKLRGQRIELEEIEAVVLQHPLVVECAVALQTFQEGDQRLVAYLVAPGLTGGELREWLKTRLPSALLPALGVPLERLPRLPNGKVNRAGLPMPERQQAGAGAAGPYSPLERQIAAIWSDVLQIDVPDPQASFFDLGGHSLLVVQVVNRIRQELAVELSLRHFWEHPTISELAALIERQRAAQPAQRETVERLMRMVQSLSEEEVQRLLQQKRLAQPKR